VIVPRPEGAPRDDVDSDAQELLKILKQADMIKKGGAWFKSTSRSRSLSGRASPLATEPNTAIR
jgi:hypothetical protein